LPHYPIKAFYHYPIPIRINEFIVQQYSPNGVNKLAFAVSEKVSIVLLCRKARDEAMY